MKNIFFMICFCFVSVYSVANDTIKAPQHSSRHTVRKAVLLSIVPGAGQIYNHLHMPKGKKKAFWKVPMIYAGLGASAYFIFSNQQQINRYREEYTFREDNNGESKFPELSVYDNSGILTIHDQYQRWRDFSILGIIAVYALQMVDAGVEAHFVTFDISEDLSMNVQPSVFQGFVPSAGVRVQLNFR